MGERQRKLITTTISDRTRAALVRWCKRHKYRLADAIDLGIASLPDKPPPPPDSRRGRPAKGARP